MGLTAWNQAEEILKNPPLKRQGANLTAEITAQPGMAPLLLAAGLHGTSVAVPAIGLARGASLREQGANNLKRIGLGFLMFHDKVGHFPTDITDPKTLKPLLSWRVAILPYIGQEALYKQFKLDEPWDSENNLKWSKTLVKVYAAPRQEQLADGQGRSLTHYMVFKGKASLFPADKKFTVTNIPDGTSYTFLCIEAKSPCIWTKPQDLPFDADKDFPALDSVVGLTPSGFQAVFCDGSVRWLRMDLDRKTMKCLIMPNDGATPVNLP